MCLKKKRIVICGQCVDCHAELCDEPANECRAKQLVNRRLSIFGMPFYD